MSETAKDIMETLVYRAKNLQEFSLTIDIPEDFRFNGRVPFDLKIDSEKLKAKVYAINFKEAMDVFNKWLETCK